jgi:hypothetical protein
MVEWSEGVQNLQTLKYDHESRGTRNQESLVLSRTRNSLLDWTGYSMEHRVGSGNIKEKKH